MHPLEKRVLLPQDLQPIQTLEDYKRTGGLQGLNKARQMTPQAIIDEVMASGLRGRGGAGFPTAMKWDTVYKDEWPTKYVVCNMAEGEPGTYKDRYLISKNPYQIFEGMLIIAHVIGAKEAILCTKTKFKSTVDRLNNALKEMEDAGVMPAGYLRIALGPDEYLLGEEKALLEAIDGRDPMPRFYPPFMVGVGYTPSNPNPTVVNNAETMSHVAHILRNGAAWFKGIGKDPQDTPGTMILTLSGDVKKPGLYEVELGLTVREFLYDLGGGPAGDKPFKAVFSGVSNRVMTPDQFDTPMGFTSLRNKGVGLGSGGFIVYDESRDMVQVAHMWSKFLAKSSCGQCVPCNSGTRFITGHLEKILIGEGTRDDLDKIRDICGRCTQQTRCFLPTQESIVIPSIMDKFPQDFERHLHKDYVFDLDRIVIPKIEYFDEGTGQFRYEKDPIEFRDDPLPGRIAAI